MEIFVEVLDGEKKSTLQMKGASQENEKMLIGGFFQMMGTRVAAPKNYKGGRNEENVGLTRAVEKAVTSIKNLAGNTPEAVGLEKIEETKINEPESSSISRKLPILGQENRISIPIAEMAKITPLSNETKEEEPEYWRTGIKEDEDGTKRYKCRYWCSCGEKGNHYIPLDTEVVSCHACEGRMAVETATFERDKDGVPVRDDFGNFFIARG